MQLRTYLCMSGLSISLLFNIHALRLQVACGASPGDGTLFSVAPRGPRSASVLKKSLA
jgi:hypothetical protein